MKRKITDNWKAIEAIELAAQEQTKDPQAGFSADMFFFGEDGRSLMLSCLYRVKKGETYSKSYKELKVCAKFCPFTGKPLYEEDPIKD